MNRASRAARRRRERWAKRFRPEDIDVLLIAEAPPSAVERYFYFPDVLTQDSLFREVARAFGIEPSRERKLSDLQQLRDKGVYLIDAALEPLAGPLRVDHSRLAARIHRLRPRRIIVVKAGVFDQVYGPLRERRLPVIDERIPFPGNGQQLKFRAAMKRALRRKPPR
jgi:hypothetical protein